MMDSRQGLPLLSLAIFGCIFAYADTTSLVISDISVTPVNYETTTRSRMPEAVDRKDQLCTLCEDFSALAVNYLSKNKTQTEVMDALHRACSKLHPFKQQCTLLVDYYAPLFFIEIAYIQPEAFCEKVNLCETNKLNRPQKYGNPCTICEDLTVRIITILKDPDTQLEIIELLLKGCSHVENFVQECKKLVFDYGPLVLFNIERFLETTNICTAIHVCKKPSQEYVVNALMADA